MKTKQISLSLPDNLLSAAESYSEIFGFRNVQELCTEAIREKVFESEYDEEMTKEEIELVEALVRKSILKGEIGTREDLMKALG